MSLKAILEAFIQVKPADLPKTEKKAEAPVAPAKPEKLDEPVWLKEARKHIGMQEIKGPKHNATILRWLKDLKLPFNDDETAWCGTFVGGVLNDAGKKQFIVKNPAGSRNWLNCGTKLDKPALGCIVVFWRGSKSGWEGHVGFCVGVDQKGNLMILGGNQSDAVNIKPFSVNRVLGYRWPGPGPLPERYNLPVYKSNGQVSTNEA